MQDTVEVKLPVSGSTVEIRNYTTRADDQKAEDVLYLGVITKPKIDLKSGDPDIDVDFPMANVMASTHVYVRRLVKSIDGDNSNVLIRLQELRSEDYQAVYDKVDEIVKEHSPKAKEAKNASKNDTTGK